MDAKPQGMIWKLLRFISPNKGVVPPTPEQRAIAQHLSKPRPQDQLCACMGKLNEDDPACKCAMAWHEKVDGHWYKISEERT